MIITAPEEVIEALQSLGLTSLEAEAYLTLLGSPGITGYGIAKQIQKPTANVYKALEALTAKGAAMTQDGPERRYTAVRAEEFVRQVDLRVKRTGQTIVDRLKDIAPRRSQEAIYSLHTREQADERIASMIGSASSALAVDASPDTLLPWTDALSEAGRDKTVLIKAYAPATVERCTLFLDPRGEEILRRWRVQWFHIVSDGVEALLTTYTGDHLARGIWTREPLLAVVYYEALTSEILLTGLTQLITDRPEHGPLRDFLASNLGAIRLDRRGFDRLFSRFDAAREEE